MTKQLNQSNDSSEDRFDPVFCIRCHKQLLHNDLSANGMCTACEKVMLDANTAAKAPKTVCRWFCWIIVPFGCLVVGIIAFFAGSWWYSSAKDPVIAPALAGIVSVIALLIGWLWRSLKRPYIPLVVLVAILFILDLTSLANVALPPPSHYVCGYYDSFVDIAIFCAVPAYYLGRLFNPAVVSDLVN